MHKRWRQCWNDWFQNVSRVRFLEHGARTAVLDTCFWTPVPISLRISTENTCHDMHDSFKSRLLSRVHVPSILKLHLTQNAPLPKHLKIVTTFFQRYIFSLVDIHTKQFLSIRTEQCFQEIPYSLNTHRMNVPTKQQHHQMTKGISIIEKSSCSSNRQEGPPSDIELASIPKESEKQKCSQRKKCVVFILGTVIILLWLIVLYIFLVLTNHDKNAPTGASKKNIFSQPTTAPTTHPTPSPKTTSPDPSSSPTTVSPTHSPTDLEHDVREFLLNHTTTTAARRSAQNPAAAKAIDWLVEEASQSRGALDPFNQKFLQRYGILILYFSVDQNVNRLPNRRMRNRDECSWPGMTCGRDGTLKRIKLGNRQLDGTLPAEWGFFPNLKSVDLIRNNLKGSIPEELFDILGLEQIFLYRNQLTGTISSKIGQLWKLTHFHVGDNRISGFIPPEMASTRQIRKLRKYHRLGPNTLC